VLENVLGSGICSRVINEQLGGRYETVYLELIIISTIDIDEVVVMMLRLS